MLLVQRNLEHSLVKLERRGLVIGRRPPFLVLSMGLGALSWRRLLLLAAQERCTRDFFKRLFLERIEEALKHQRLGNAVDGLLDTVQGEALGLLVLRLLSLLLSALVDERNLLVSLKEASLLLMGPPLLVKGGALLLLFVRDRREVLLHEEAVVK